MQSARRVATINVRVLIILSLVVVLLGVGAVVGHYLRKGITARRALTLGQAAFARGDWAAASMHLDRYLRAYPDDTQVLEQYARAQISVRPLDARSLGGAIGAYRQLLRLDPTNEPTYETLAQLYRRIENYDELAYVADQRLQRAPDDPQARLWKARAWWGKLEPERAAAELGVLVKQLESQEGERRPEFAEACALLSALATEADSGTALERTAAEWLDDAVQYDPSSAVALVRRAAFRRIGAGSAPEGRAAALTAARRDLEQVEALSPRDPRVRLMLGKEWLEHGDEWLEHAAAQFAATAQLEPGALEKYSIHPDDWLILRFVSAADLALRQRATQAGVDLANEALAALPHRSQRMKVLPAAIELYAAAHEMAPARRWLEEYRDAVNVSDLPARFDETLALLEAVVARAAGKPYRVIDALEPFLNRAVSRARLWQLLADAYEQTQQVRRATIALAKYLRREPDDRQAARQLARQFMKLRDWAAVFEILGSPQRPGSQDLEATLLRVEAGIQAAARRAEGVSPADLDVLAGQLDDLGQTYPDAVDIRVLRASLAAAAGRPEEAERELRRAIDECSDSLPAEMALAHLYFRSRRVNEAIEVCEAACSRHAADATPWLALGEILEANEQDAAARAALQAGSDAVPAGSQRRMIEMQLAMFDLRHGARQAGIERLQKLTEEDADYVRSRSLLLDLPEIRTDEEEASRLIADLKEIEGQRGLLWRVHEAAFRMSGRRWRDKQKDIQSLLEYCIDAVPAWSSPVVLLGRLHERLGNPNRAEAIYRRGLSVRPEASEVAGRLLTLLGQQKRYADARELLDQLEPYADDLSRYRVTLAIGAGDVRAAIETLKLRIASDPNDAEALVLLARLIYRETRDVQTAFGYLAQAVAAAGESANVVATRAAILRAEGQADKARALLDGFVQRAQSFEAVLLRATFLLRDEQIELAEKDYLRLAEFPDNPEGYQLLGMFYARTGQADEAIAAWERGLGSYPQHVGLQRRLVPALLTRGGAGDRDHAEQILAELEREIPDHPDVLWLRALLLLEAGTADATDRARQLLTRVTEIEPTAVAGHLKLIELALRSGDADEARRLAIRGLAARPDNPELLLARARAEQALNNLSLARELARLVLRQQPANVDANVLFVDASLRARGQADQVAALAVAERVLEQDPASEPLQLARARLLAALDRADESIARLEAFRQASPDGPKSATLVTLAELHRGLGHHGDAERYVQLATESDPEIPAVLKVRVLSHGLRKEFDQIAALLRGERPEPPYTADVLVTASSFLASSDQAAHRALAAQLLEGVLERAATPLELRLDVANLLYRVGAADRAEQAYRGVLAAHPENGRAINDLAWILAEARQDYHGALALADRGLELDPQHLNLLDTRGVILSDLGRLKEAREDFQRCVRIIERNAAGSGAHARALLQLGRVCVRLSDKGAAQRCLRRALEIDRQRGVFTPEQRLEVSKLLQTEGPG